LNKLEYDEHKEKIHTIAKGMWIKTTHEAVEIAEKRE